MNKSKDKHHLPEEAKKNTKSTDAPAPADDEPAKETPSDQKTQAAAEPTEAGPGSAEAGKMQKTAQEIDQLKDQLLRLRADFDNFRKRSLREKGEIYENANEALMLELLPIIDHLQLAIKSAKDQLALGGVKGQAHSTGSPRPELGTKAGQAHSAGSGQADQTFQEGIQMIFDQLLNTLSKYGLNQFNSEKQPFDPTLHEAISCLPSETGPEGTIIAQSRQGYRFKNTILRPAQVVVSSGKPVSPPPETNDQTGQLKNENGHD